MSTETSILKNRNGLRTFVLVTIATAGVGPKVFVHWFLSKEGQQWYSKIFENGTRCLDVDTRWLKDLGVNAAKDAIVLQEYNRVRNHLAGNYTKVRLPAGKFAETLLRPNPAASSAVS